MKALALQSALVVGIFVVLAFPVAAENGSLKVTSFPSGALVVVDGVSTGKVTPMSISLSVGEHTVTVTIPNSGWQADTRTVTIVTGNNDLSVTLLPVLREGPAGPKGDQGDQGDKGDPGVPGPGAESIFAPGDYVGCYTGPPGTRNLGVCVGGAREFQNGAFGMCLGQILPASETCNEIDDDCDGIADDGINCGPPVCVPSTEVCNGRDDDCDGLIDEGISCESTDSTIQAIQDGTVPVGSPVSIDGVMVTLARINPANGSVDMYVQEPLTAGDYPYPFYAGVAAFLSGAEASAFPDVTSLAIGDCVNLGGVVGEFQSGTQIQSLSSLVKVGGAGTCGTPVPHVITNVCQVATDVNLEMPDDQPSPTAEALEGALLNIVDVIVTAGLDAFGRFRVGEPSGRGCDLLVNTRYLSGGMSVTVGAAITSITGVYNQAGSFQLFPRNAADVP